MRLVIDTDHPRLASLLSGDPGLLRVLVETGLLCVDEHDVNIIEEMGTGPVGVTCARRWVSVDEPCSRSHEVDLREARRYFEEERAALAADPVLGEQGAYPPTLGGSRR